MASIFLSKPKAYYTELATYNTYISQCTCHVMIANFSVSLLMFTHTNDRKWKQWQDDVANIA